jgi:hypothetical protein
MEREFPLTQEQKDLADDPFSIEAYRLHDSRYHRAVRKFCEQTLATKTRRYHRAAAAAWLV